MLTKQVLFSSQACVNGNFHYDRVHSLQAIQGTPSSWRLKGSDSGFMECWGVGLWSTKFKSAGEDMNLFRRGETCGHLSHHGFDRLEPLVVEVVCMEVEQAAGLGVLHSSPPPAQRCLLWTAPKTRIWENPTEQSLHVWNAMYSDPTGEPNILICPPWNLCWSQRDVRFLSS